MSPAVINSISIMLLACMYHWRLGKLEQKIEVLERWALEMRDDDDA